MGKIVEIEDQKLGGLRRYMYFVLHNRKVFAGHTVLFLVLLAALIAPLFSEPALEQRLSRAMEAPSFAGTFSGETPLMGTDSLGRDLAARLVVAVRVSVMVGGLSVAIACVVGTILGLISGYFGGTVDNIIMRIVDALLSLPFVVLAIAIVAAIGSGLINVAMVLGLTGWVTFAKLVRGEVLQIKQMPFIEAAKSIGCSHARILVRHISPQVLGIVLVNITLSFGQMIIAEATLSFLGLGIPPSTPTLGGILSAAQETFFAAWWVVVFPGILLMLIVLSVNIVGDWLRDYFDPKVNFTMPVKGAKGSGEAGIGNRRRESFSVNGEVQS